MVIVKYGAMVESWLTGQYNSDVPMNHTNKFIYWSTGNVEEKGNISPCSITHHNMKMRGSTGDTVPHINFSIGWRWVINFMLQSLHSSRKSVQYQSGCCEEKNSQWVTFSVDNGKGNWCNQSIILYAFDILKKYSMAWIRERTIPTERPPLLGEVSANFCG
jgi:hypothetical protein